MNDDLKEALKEAKTVNEQGGDVARGRASLALLIAMAEQLVQLSEHLAASEK